MGLYVYVFSLDTSQNNNDVPIQCFYEFFLIIRGPLRCGKSTIAERLSKILNAKHFAVDRVLDDHNLTEDKEAGYISQKSFIKANEIIAPEAKRILDSKKPVVFDGNFYWKSQIEDLIQRLDFLHHVFTLKAPLEVCIARDEKRGKTHGADAARAVYKKSTEFDYGIVIDVQRPLDDCVHDLLSYLPKPYFFPVSVIRCVPSIPRSFFSLIPFYSKV